MPLVKVEDAPDTIGMWAMRHHLTLNTPEDFVVLVAAMMKEGYKMAFAYDQLPMIAEHTKRYIEYKNAYIDGAWKVLQSRDGPFLIAHFELKKSLAPVLDGHGDRLHETVRIVG